MTGPQVTAVLALTVVVVMLAVTALQPRRLWRETAEHSKVFWLAWALGSVVIGAVPAAIVGWGWAEAAWLAIWCGCGALQPAMIVDILDVRQQVRRRRAAATRERRLERATNPQLPPIRWRADS